MNLLLQTMESSFPRSAAYRRGLASGALCEAPAPFRTFPYRERHLQCLWADPRHRPAALKTSEGEPIEVEHPGDWNLEAGPDFLNAVLRVGKERRRISGDLEIHVHAQAWRQHGHADDPRYASVRFHIVYFPGMEIPGLLQIPLQEPLAANPRFSFENIDTAAYPYSIPAGDFPLRGMDPAQKTEWLESAGEERLRLKAERLVLAMQNKEPVQVLWEELMAALGYKQNKLPFRQLASTLTAARLQALARAPEEAYALLLGLAGLLPANPDPTWSRETRDFIRSLWDGWWKQSGELKEQALNKAEWTLAGIRPANHPVRRLMAAAHLVFHLHEIPENRQLLAEQPANFWTTHISWKTACAPTALVGEPRANAIATNLLVPFRAATGETKLDFGHLPVEPLNSVIRQTAHALFGPDHPPKIYRSALARQGLIQVFHDYLATRRLEELRSLA